MNLDAIPEPRIGSGPAPTFAYSGNPTQAGSLVTVAPPPQMPTPQGPRRQRMTGLIPATPGSVFPMIRTEGPRVHVDPREVSETRAKLRKAKVQVEAKRAALLASANPGEKPSEEYTRSLLASRDASDLVAALTLKLVSLEASSASRPIKVTLATVREPSEVADEIAKHPVRYVCLHDGCKGGPGWEDEGSMRRAHPTDTEMKRAQQCHVFALMVDAPLDPLDPDNGEIVGYVGPRGSDGTTVARAVAQSEEASTYADADEVESLKATVADLKAAMAEMAGKSAKK